MSLDPNDGFSYEGFGFDPEIRVVDTRTRVVCKNTIGASIASRTTLGRIRWNLNRLWRRTITDRIELAAKRYLESKGYLVE